MRQGRHVRGPVLLAAEHEVDPAARVRLAVAGRLKGIGDTDPDPGKDETGAERYLPPQVAAVTATARNVQLSAPAAAATAPPNASFTATSGIGAICFTVVSRTLMAKLPSTVPAP